MVTIGTPAMEMIMAITADTTLHALVYVITCLSLSFFPPYFRYRSFMIMVDIHRRLESAEDMVAQMIAAEMIPTITPGACAVVTAIMALAPPSARSGMVASAARPSRVGKMDIAAMRTAESHAACFAVFSSLAVSKRDTISGPARKVQK